MSNKIKIAVFSAITAVLLCIAIVAHVVCAQWSPILEVFLGKVGAKRAQSDYKTDYPSDAAYIQARIDTCKDLEGEGAVLLKNDNAALPLEDNAKVSIFGQHSINIKTGGSGSGSVGGADTSRTLKKILEEKTISVNPELDALYRGTGLKLGNGPALAGSGQNKDDWSINECPVNKYTAAVRASYAEYGDAAIVVISRTGGEGGDLPMSMEKFGGGANEHYLELTRDEKDMLNEVKNSFDRIIVVLNTMNPMETGFLAEYGVDACLWIGGTGANGLDAVGELLKGERNPSGRLVDTYLYDNLSAPSAQNFGDFTYTNCDYHYVSYNEGVYVGYRYYETRYEDSLVGRDNGTFDYDAAVAFPFGYGLSYTEFEWSGFDCAYDAATDSYIVTVDVKNVGERAGKDVVEVYVQKPYTSGGTEKPSVELVGFAKTDELAQGESKPVTVTVERRSFASFDYKTDKTYVLDGGKYYLTAARNAHSATKNILAQRSVAGATADMSGFTAELELAEDKAKYARDAATGTDITTLFDYATYDGMTVLSRENWKAVDDGIAATGLALSDANIAQHELKGKAASRNTVLTTSEKAEVGKKGGAKLSDMLGKELDDPEWDKLVKQIGLGDLVDSFCSAGYRTIELSDIGKPECTDSDGPAGIQSFVGGASAVKAYGYVIPSVVSSTWNKELAERQGRMVGEDGLRGNVAGWYAPAMDTHRSAFGGRNFEYYSEGGVLGGEISAAIVKGAQGKGLYCYIKHFALNEQDANRGQDLLTWCDEQAMREVYLKPFQIAVQKGGALGCMTALDCIGPTYCSGNYDLITRLLKDEWGFKGIVTTDYNQTNSATCEQVLFAGGDTVLQTQKIRLSSRNDAATQLQLQRAVKRVLYVTTRSNGMAGTSGGFPVYMILLITLDVLFVAAAALMWFFGYFRKLIKARKAGNTEGEQNADDSQNTDESGVDAER